jgi:hypothetical protein
MLANRFAIVALVAGAALCTCPALAAPKGSVEDRAAAFHSCEAAGGSMKSCCEKAGGTYSTSQKTMPSGRVVTIESCGIALKVYTREVRKLGQEMTLGNGLLLRAN